MASNFKRAVDIKGLTPALDLRRSDDWFAVGGKNFAFTSLGPRSIFGNRFLTSTPQASPNHIQGIRLRLRSGDRSFIFPGDAILEWDESTLSWITIYDTSLTPTNITPHRWTAAYVNGLMFFCHPVVGIVFYNVETEEVGLHDGPGLPVAPIAICSNSGRLIVMDDTYLSWSWQSDGMNFTPALGEAGQQKINDRVAGFPIMINSYAQGIITWTTGGMMQSQFTGDQEVYRHRNLNTEYRPVNSFCTLQTDENTAVILDERGLFQSQGGAPVPLAPLFNEFLIDYIRRNDLTIGQNLRIEWDDLRRLMFVSVSVTEMYPRYEKAFVLYPPLDKWGTFNESHLGILPITIQENQRQGQYYGFADVDGRVKYWNEFPSREQMNEAETATEIVGLDAKVQIGLIRFPEISDSFDRMSEVIAVMIGNQESGPEDQFSEDYLQVPDGVDDEDYLTEMGNEDFGENTLAFVNFNLRVISTVDGRATYQEAVPELSVFKEGVRHYTCSTVGIWHILEASADSAGEAFHLRAIELNAVDAGLYS